MSTMLNLGMIGYFCVGPNLKQFLVMQVNLQNL